MIAAKIDDVVAAVVNGLDVLRTRDGVELTDNQIRERAVNIAQALIGAELDPAGVLAAALHAKVPGDQLRMAGHHLDQAEDVARQLLESLERAGFEVRPMAREVERGCGPCQDGECAVHVLPPVRHEDERRRDEMAGGLRHVPGSGDVFDEGDIDEGDIDEIRAIAARLRTRFWL